MNSWIKRNLPLCIALTVFGYLLITIFSVAMAATDVESYARSGRGSETSLSLLRGGVGIPGFDEIFNSLGTELIRSARYIVAIMIAVSGIMVAFGIEDGKKQVWAVILAIGFALNMGSFIYTTYNSYFGGNGNQEATGTVEMQVLTPGESESGVTKEQGVDEAKSKAAHPKKTYTEILTPKENPAISGNDYHYFSSFINSYVKYVIQPGANNVKSILIKLALLITVIDASINLALDLTGGNFAKFIISLALKLGFNIFLMENWLTGVQLTQSLCNGFEELGLKAAGLQMEGNHLVLAGMSDGAVTAAIVIFGCFVAVLSAVSLFTMSPIPLMLGLGLALVFIVTMVWIALEMFLAQIEFYTMALLTMMLLPFMMSKHTSFLSQNAIAAMFNCALKVCVIAFLSSVGMVSLGKYLDDISKLFMNLSPQNLGNLVGLLIQMCITTVILGILIWRIPALVQSVLTGSPSMGVSDTINTVRSAVATTASVASTAAGGAGLLKGAAAAHAAGGGAGVGQQMMSSLKNLGGSLKEMGTGVMSSFSGGDGMSHMKAGWEKMKNGASDAGGAIMTAGKIAGSAAANGIDSYAYNSGIRQSFENAIETGKGNSRRLSQDEKDAGATSKNWSGEAIHADGHVMDRKEVSQRAAAARQSESNPYIEGDETRNVDRTVTTNVDTNNVVKYNNKSVVNPQPIPQFNPNDFYGA